MESMLPNEVRNIATDPGTVNHGLCQLAFSGYSYQTQRDGQVIKVPQFRILNWELWDLKRKLKYSANEKFGVATNRYGSPNNNAPSDSFVSLSENMAHFVADSPWMFESYRSALYGDEGEKAIPAIVTELQCGVVKNGELEVVLMSYELPTCVKAIDITHGCMDRQIVSRARKYGIPSDGALSYAQRKAKSVEVGTALLKMVGMNDWLTYIDNIAKARKRDVPHKPPQTHDMFDALLLCLASCEELYENLYKWLEKDAKSGDSRAQFYIDMIQTQVNEAQLSQRQEKPIEIEIRDSSSEEDEAPKKKKTTKPTKEKSDLRKRADAVHESFIEHDKNKKRRREAKELRYDLHNLLGVAEDEPSESDEKPKKSPRKRAKKTTTPDVAKKYTQLTLSSTK